MRILLLILFAIVLAIVSYWCVNTFLKARISKKMMEINAVYRNVTPDHSRTLLVLGDSTGAGVGTTKPEDAVSGRLAKDMGATYVENYAVSGAEVEDLLDQIQKAELDRYTTILVQIGGNDILAFHKISVVGPRLKTILGTLPPADTIILMSAGNAGGATIFPPPIRYFHTKTNLEYHAAFGTIAKELGIIYVNLYKEPKDDLFLKHPHIYLSEDGLHPSSEGYRLWFEELKKTVSL